LAALTKLEIGWCPAEALPATIAAVSCVAAPVTVASITASPASSA
jgi:hypothetical protein